MNCYGGFFAVAIFLSLWAWEQDYRLRPLCRSLGCDHNSRLLPPLFSVLPHPNKLKLLFGRIVPCAMKFQKSIQNYAEI